jgi:hypothetical protein
MLVAEISLSLTEASLPEWFPLTEHDVIQLLHSAFPGFLALLQLLAVHLHVDADKQCAALVGSIIAQHKVGAFIAYNI